MNLCFKAVNANLRREPLINISPQRSQRTRRNKNRFLLKEIRLRRQRTLRFLMDFTQKRKRSFLGLWRNHRAAPGSDAGENSDSAFGEKLAAQVHSKWRCQKFTSPFYKSTPDTPKSRRYCATQPLMCQSVTSKLGN